MLMIRLQRVGRRKQPSYRFVVSDRTKDTQGKAVEIVGIYNPLLKEKVINIKKDRVLHWLSKGAKTSDTVHNIFLGAGIVTGEKRNKIHLSKKRKEALEKEKGGQQSATEAKA